MDNKLPLALVFEKCFQYLALSPTDIRKISASGDLFC